MIKKVIKSISLSEHQHNTGFSSVSLRSSTEMNLDPFLNIDLFKMSEPTFRPHPHAGFSAVTYMLPESQGPFVNRDSFGDKSLIQPGDLHWTQAGSGIMHEEVPLQFGQECLGFQIFVNLSQNNKNIPPRALHINSQDVPEIKKDKLKVKIVVGDYENISSPMKGLATPVTILDLTLEAFGKTILNLKSNLNWFIFVISGDGKIAGEINLQKHQAFLLSQESEQFQFESFSSTLRILVCGGQSIHEPIVWGGPFCMTSIEDIQKAKERFKKGEMGFLEPSF